jgi:hypothetical protein
MLDITIYCYTWVYVRVSALIYRHDPEEAEDILRTADITEEVAQVAEHTIIGG